MASISETWRLLTCTQKDNAPMTFVFLIFLVAFHPTWPVQAAQGCLSYEPNAVALHGRIGRHTFAGRSNYESVAKGDEAEHVWVLHLAKPICVDASSDWEREGSVSDIQLCVSQRSKSIRYLSIIVRPKSHC